ncbi:cation diffusion facilitator family transporter [Fibrobacterota bacterium]
MEKTAEVKKVTWISVAANIFLCLLKLVLGILGSSQALVADGIHSLSDMTTDIAILFGVKYWSAPADEDHPYGHGRIETIVTTFIGLILAMAALGIGYSALGGIRDEHIQQPGLIALAGALVSILLKEGLYRWTFSVGKRIKSSALMANAWHQRTDALSSIPVALAVLIAVVNPAWSFVDHLGAFVVSLFILHAAYKILKPSFIELTDSGVGDEVRQRIRQSVLSVDGVKSVHALRTRKSGPGVYVDLHIQVEGSMTVREGHDISGKVKHGLKNLGLEIIDAVVHVEPV